MTEAMKKKIVEMDVATNVKVVLPRNSSLEAHLLQNAAAIRNRRLLSAPIKNIPFGIRGRRRVRRQTVLFIGMRPNPDNVRQNQPSTSSLSAPAQTPSTSAQPPTPESPARNVVDASNDNSCIELTFSDAFGRLSLDSDSD